MVQELLGKPLRNKFSEKIASRIEKGQRINGYIIVNPQFIPSVSYATLIKKRLEKLNQRVFYKEVNSFEEAEFTLKEAEMDPIGSVFLSRPLGFKNESKLIESIRAEKDADMLTSVNLGKLTKGDLHYLSGTSKAVESIIDYYKIAIEGKKALVIGRSLSVGLPISLLLLKKNAELTVVHSHVSGEEIHNLAVNADIVVLASGKRGLFNKDDVKEGQVILDCGFHDDGHGDIDFVPEKAAFYTPVPRGIGPVTIMALIENAFFLLYGELEEDA